MDEAKRLLNKNKIKDIALIVSNHQENGKGTKGRKWSSPKDAGIYFSIVHKAKEGSHFEATTTYTLACGIACIEALQKICKISTRLKPVNDIYFDNKKLGGILVESSLTQKGISYLITGIGINIKKYDHTLDRALIEPISIEEILNEKDFKDFKKEDLIEAISDNICLWYDKVFNGDKKVIESTWEKYRL